MPRVTANAGRVPPERRRRRSLRERLLNAGVVLAFIYFALFVVVSLIAWAALVNH